ncbi:hypothetical protein LWI29_002599 [Acer saccharum]|uniref:RNase H type-1 domain-containing protein n=1 Tax=Acer saccharum TaxID=4024 RepID=A0AA39RQQ2_ACESA|nr:hypothetical protein LWI29_002599 [Acer saccharum]
MDLGTARKGRRKEDSGDKWRPPNQRLLKINCNTSFDKGKRRIGFGSIIRNAKGRVVACCSQVCEANFDLETAKVMVVWKGISFGRNCGLDCFVVEMDSETVINNIVKGSNSDSRYGCILCFQKSQHGGLDLS